MADESPTPVSPPSGTNAKVLGWLDCASLIIGIMLGTGIFVTFPTLAAGHNTSFALIMLAWVLGMFVAWFGAMCYAELSTIFPLNGGDYVFLREAYSHDGKSAVGFLFAWVQFFVIRPASLIALAIILGMHLNILFKEFYLARTGSLPLESHLDAMMTIWVPATLIFFTVVAVFGVQLSKWVQNLLTFLKVICLCLIIICGLVLCKGKLGNLEPFWLPAEPTSAMDIMKHLGMALIPIMWVFGGWNEAPYIAGEMKNPEKNIPLALTAGLFGIGILYLITNFVYLVHLTPQGLSETWTIAPTLMKQWFGIKGELLMATVIVISCAGAINGLIFTGGRMTQVFCFDFAPLHMFSENDPYLNSPSPALIVNCLIAMVIGAWSKFTEQSIDRLLYFTSGVVWLFFGLTVFAVFIFRKRFAHHRQIPFRVPLFPWTPIIFLIMCGYMIYGAYDYKPDETMKGLAILACGLPVFYFLHPERWASRK